LTVLGKNSFVIDGKEYFYQTSGPCCWGADEILLHRSGEINLAYGTSWNDKGFVVADLPIELNIDELYRCINNYLIGCLLNFGVQVPNTFRLEKYHEYIADEELH